MVTAQAAAVQPAASPLAPPTPASSAHQPRAVVPLVGSLGVRRTHPAEDAGQHGEHQHRGQHAEERADGARARGCAVLPRDGRGAGAGHLVVWQGHRGGRRHHWCRWHHGRHCSTRRLFVVVTGLALLLDQRRVAAICAWEWKWRAVRRLAEGKSVTCFLEFRSSVMC
jgi:hypothetical protein